MTAEEAIDALKGIYPGIDTNGNLTSLVFTSKQGNNPPKYLVKRANIANDLVSYFTNVSKDILEHSCQLNCIPYSPTYKPEFFEIMYIDIGANDLVKNLVDTLVNVAGLENMVDDSQYTKKLSFYGIVHNVEDKQILLLRNMTAKNILKRSKRLGIFYRNGVYDRMESEILMLDDDIDCFAYQGYMFILNVRGFHRITHYHSEVINAAKEVIDEAVLKIPISNIDDFVHISSSDYRMATKLASIKGKAYLKALTFDKVKDIIRDFELPIEVGIDDVDGQEKLKFDPDIKKRFLILKILDDDYLHSTMTDQNYAVNSKKQS